MALKYVDCDGHVMENSDELVKYVGEPFKTTGHMNARRILPSLDRFHTPRLEERKPGTFDPSVGPEKWVQFLDKAGLEFSVLFPTDGLAYGQIVFPPWAVAYARAYNDWLAAKYLNFNSRLKGMALIPMQDVPAAVAELRRAVFIVAQSRRTMDASRRSRRAMSIAFIPHQSRARYGSSHRSEVFEQPLSTNDPQDPNPTHHQ